MRKLVTSRTRTTNNTDKWTMRYRDYLSECPAWYMAKPYAAKNTDTSWDSEKEYPGISNTITTHDVVHPHYTKIRAEGGIVCNDYENIKSYHVGGPLVISTQGRDPNTLYYQGEPYKAALSHSDLEIDSAGCFKSSSTADIRLADENQIDLLCDLAITKAYANMSDVEAQINVSLLEATKTIRSLNRLFREALYFIRASKQVKRSLARGLLSTSKAASLWLEYRYGLRPIYFDIVSQIKALQAVGDRARARATAHVEIPVVQYDGSTEEEIVCPRSSRQATITSCVKSYGYVSAGVLFEPRNELVSFKDAFGSDDYISSMWELVPFSFIVDWFINSGDYVLALDNNTQVDVLTSWVKIVQVFERLVIDAKYVNSSWPDYYDVDHSWFGTCSRVTTRTRRIANPLLPSFVRPNIRLDGLKIADILTLIKQIR